MATSDTIDLAALGPRQLAKEIDKAHGDHPSWLDELAEALDRRRSGRALERLMTIWGLSQAEAARQFGVSRQALSKWLERGVPTERLEALADLSAATDLLVRYLKRDRIPAVVRRHAAALGGRSLVDLVAAGQTRDVLAACREMFAFEHAQG